MQVLSFLSIKWLYWFLKMVKENDSLFDSFPVKDLLFSLKLGAIDHLSLYFEPCIKKKKRYECFKIVREYRGRRESGHTE